MQHDYPIATIFGGSGFVGGYIAAALAKAGYRVQIISRTPERALWVRTAAAAGDVVLRQGNIRDEKMIEQAVRGSDIVVNAVGLLYESGKQSFTAVHAQAAERIAKAAKAADVKQLVHISALGVDKATGSKYARSKINGEKAVLAAFPGAAILRPGVVFGPEDNFLNLFAKMTKLSPFLPLIGGGKTRFQPVYVADVADAVVAVLDKPDSKGKTYQLGGPRIYSFRELMEYLLTAIDTKRWLLPVPFALAKLKALVLQLLPIPPLTVDQVRLLQHDNVVEAGQPGFKELGILPRTLEAIAPSYLARYRG